MSWVKIDDHFAEDDLVANLTDRAFRLHLIALCYCARNLTDGVLDSRAIRVVCAVLTSGRANRWVNELVDSGLWVKADGQYEIKNYLDYNPSAEKVKEERRKARDRQRRHRGSNGVTNAERSGTPSRPVPKEQEPSIDDPSVDNLKILTDFEEWADTIGLEEFDRALARKLGPQVLEQKMVAVRSRGDVENPRAYFAQTIRSKQAELAPYRSLMPREERLRVWVKSVAQDMSDGDMLDELTRVKGVLDEELLRRLVEYANELRSEAA